MGKILFLVFLIIIIYFVCLLIIEKQNDKKRIILLMGASGSGKTTLGMFLRELGIPELISHTTRQPRVGEVEGDPYHFITKEEFDKIDKVEETEYAGNFYCLAKSEVEDKLKKFKRVYCITDSYGMQHIRQKYGDMVKVIYISVTLAEMKKRMKDRGDSEEVIEKRIQNAIKNNELGNGSKADSIVRNDNLLKAKRDLLKEISFKLYLKSLFKH